MCVVIVTQSKCQVFASHNKILKNDLLEARSIGTRNSRTTVNAVSDIATWTIATSHALLCVMTLGTYAYKKGLHGIS